MSDLSRLPAQRPTIHPPGLSRRHWLLAAAAAPLLGACASTPLPLSVSPNGRNDGAQRLLETAQAHGLAAYRDINNINVSYGGQWRPFIGRIQPEVVDSGYRIKSEERLLPKLAINAQAYRGPAGHKQVWWQRGPQQPAAATRSAAAGTTAPASANWGQARVWYNGVANTEPAVLRAAALVAECYGLFLLGPLWLVDRNLPAQLNGTEQVDGQTCDVLDLWLQPGLGLVARDRVSLCIDRRTNLTRRMRFTLEGFSGTQGAVAETDTFDHQTRFGVSWPMRSFERVRHPLRLPAHDWFITGLDVNRGYDANALAGATYTGAAAAPAQAV